MPEEDPSQKNNVNSSAMISSVWNIMGGMLGCPLLGYWIGTKFGDLWTGTLIGLFVGLLYSGFEIWKLASKNR